MGKVRTISVLYFTSTHQIHQETRASSRRLPSFPNSQPFFTCPNNLDSRLKPQTQNLEERAESGERGGETAGARKNEVNTAPQRYIAISEFWSSCWISNKYVRFPSNVTLTWVAWTPAKDHATHQYRWSDDPDCQRHAIVRCSQMTWVMPNSNS